MVLEHVERFGTPDENADAPSALLAEIRRTAGMVQWLDEVIRLDDASPEMLRKHFEERQHLTRACKMAMDAGIDERMVKISEKQLRLASEVVRRILSDERLCLTQEQKAAVPVIARSHIAAVRE